MKSKIFIVILALIVAVCAGNGLNKNKIANALI